MTPRTDRMNIYIAQMSNGEWATFPTITEARRWAEEFGTTADDCTIYRGTDEVALHVRDTSGNGTRWHRAALG